MATTEQIRLTLIDDVSAQLQKIGGFTEDLSRGFSEGLVDGVSSAVKGMGTFNSKTEQVGNKLGGLRSSIEGVGNKLSSFGNHLKSAVLQPVVMKAFDLIAGGFEKIKAALITGNAEFERYEVQFGVLLGSTGLAKKRLEELAEFGAKTPFELPEVVRTHILGEVLALFLSWHVFDSIYVTIAE